MNIIGRQWGGCRLWSHSFSPWPFGRRLPVQLPCWLLCLAKLREQRPGVHGRKRRSASTGGGEPPGWWRSGWQRPPPHSDLQTGSRCLKPRKKRPRFSIFFYPLNCFPWAVKLPLTGHSSRDGAPQGRHSSHGNLLRCVLFGAGVSSCHHVGLQQGALQVHMVVRQSLVHSSKNLEIHRKFFHIHLRSPGNWANVLWWFRTNLLCDVLATQQVVVSIREDLWLHNGHQAVLVRTSGLASPSWWQFRSLQQQHLPVGRCWRIWRARWHSLQWQEPTGSRPRSSGRTSTWRSHSRPSCTGRNALRARQDLRGDGTREMRRLEPQFLSGEGFLGLWTRSSPCVVVSPSVPFRPAVPLST